MKSDGPGHGVRNTTATIVRLHLLHKGPKTQGGLSFLDAQAELEKQIQRERALAEAEGRIRQQRENEDVNRREMILQYQERTKLVIQAIGETFAHVGRGAFAVVTDADLLFRTAGLSALLLLGFFGTREASRVVGRTVERWLGTPKLVRASVRIPLYDIFTSVSKDVGSGVKRCRLLYQSGPALHGRTDFSYP